MSHNESLLRRIQRYYEQKKAKRMERERRLEEMIQLLKRASQ